MVLMATMEPARMSSFSMAAFDLTRASDTWPNEPLPMFLSSTYRSSSDLTVRDLLSSVTGWMSGCVCVFVGGIVFVYNR